MSVPAARAFLPALRQLDGRLLVPMPDRVRILRELEYDLEELEGRLLARGLPPEEARSLALESLVPDGVTLDELARVHAPLYRRLTRRLSEERVRLLERSALGVAATSVLLGETWILLTAQLLRSPSPFLWPVLALGAVLGALILATLFELCVKREHTATDGRLGGILALSGAILTLGTVGTTVDVHRLAALLERSPGLASALVAPWLVREASLLSVAILLAMAGGLTWFLLTQWVVSIREAHRRVLGVGFETARERR